MAVVDSKLKTGKLVLGGIVSPAVPPAIEVSCQPTNVRLEPTFNETGDAVETLCGDTLSPATTCTWALMGTSIQDFDNKDGLLWYCYENNLLNKQFMWQPNTGATKFTGTVNIRAVNIGGDVNIRNTSDFEFPVQGAITIVKPALMLAEVAAPETMGGVIVETEPAPA